MCGEATVWGISDQCGSAAESQDRAAFTPPEAPRPSRAHDERTAPHSQPSSKIARANARRGAMSTQIGSTASIRAFYTKDWGDPRFSSIQQCASSRSPTRRQSALERPRADLGPTFKASRGPCRPWSPREEPVTTRLGSRTFDQSDHSRPPRCPGLPRPRRPRAGGAFDSDSGHPSASSNSTLQERSVRTVVRTFLGNTPGYR